MSKKYKHWNDNKYEGLKEPFRTGKLADDIHKNLVQYLLNDFQKELEGIDEIKKRYLIQRFDKASSYVEDICYLLRDANAIKKWYGIDYKMRRERWTTARGLCFRLMGLLDDTKSFIPETKNTQKYVDLSGDLMNLASMIQNIILSDDKDKKKNCKQYMGNT